VKTAISQSQAAEVVGGSAKQFDELLKAEQKRWPELIKSAGIKID
jgi:hypothetical protein